MYGDFTKKVECVVNLLFFFYTELCLWSMNVVNGIRASDLSGANGQRVVAKWDKAE